MVVTRSGRLELGDHTIKAIGIGRDASLTVRGRLLGGANKGASFPQYHEWYCVRCQRGGCWATKFSCFRCGLSRLESEAAAGGFPHPTSKCGGKGKGVFREAQYPGRSGGGDGVPRNVPPTTRRVPNQGNSSAGPAMQIDQLLGLLTGLGCSAAVLGEVQEADKAKAKPRVVPAAEQTVFVLKDKWDRAEAHRQFLQDTAERKQREYEAASQRATDQAVVADDLKKASWKARKELDKTAASSASASVGERESVSSDDGLANAGSMTKTWSRCIQNACWRHHLLSEPRPGLAPTSRLLTNLLARQLLCRHLLPRSRTKTSNKLCERCSHGLRKPSTLWFGSAPSIASKKRHSRGLLGNLPDGNKEGIFDDGWTVVKKKKKTKKLLCPLSTVSGVFNDSFRAPICKSVTKSSPGLNISGQHLSFFRSEQCWLVLCWHECSPHLE